MLELFFIRCKRKPYYSPAGNYIFDARGWNDWELVHKGARWERPAGILCNKVRADSMLVVDFELIGLVNVTGLVSAQSGFRPR